MKTKRTIWIVVVLFVGIIALTTWHSFPGSRLSVHWDGARYWSFKKFGKTEGGDFIHGHMENRSTVYIVGPISIWKRND